jgi:rRNA maturation endonuclease Nob1
MIYYFQCFNCVKVQPLSDEHSLKCEHCGSEHGQRRTQDEYDNFNRLGWFKTPLLDPRPHQ